MSGRLEDIYQKCLFGHVIDGTPSHDKTRTEFAYPWRRRRGPFHAARVQAATRDRTYTIECGVLREHGTPRPFTGTDLHRSGARTRASTLMARREEGPGYLVVIEPLLPLAASGEPGDCCVKAMPYYAPSAGIMSLVGCAEPLDAALHNNHGLSTQFMDCWTPRRVSAIEGSAWTSALPNQFSGVERTWACNRPRADWRRP
jgi:hypothetical protein